MADDLDDAQLVGVLAHGLLNSMAVVHGALATLLAEGDRLDRDALVTLVTGAIAQTDHVSETLRGLVQGLPSDVLVFLDDLGRQRER